MTTRQRMWEVPLSDVMLLSVEQTDPIDCWADFFWLGV